MASELKSVPAGSLKPAFVPTPSAKAGVLSLPATTDAVAVLQSSEMLFLVTSRIKWAFLSPTAKDSPSGL
eukprot:2467964-Rhodomonas_salina.1